MDTAARQRLADGQAASAQATGRLETRRAELLGAALRTEEAARTEHAPQVPSTTPGDHPPGLRDAQLNGQGVPAAPGVAGPSAGAWGTGSDARVDRALALVERIERFVRSGRPSLALTLRGELRGQVEIERVGAGAIALRLSSSRPPSADELGELRHALEARGLAVRSLEARQLPGESDGER